MGKDNNDLKTAGNNISNIAKNLHNSNQEEKKKGKKKILIILLLLLLVIGIGLGVAIMMISSASRPQVNINAKDINARVEVSCNIIDAVSGQSTVVKVDGNTIGHYVFNSDKDAQNDTIYKTVKFDTAEIVNGNSVVQFFYKIENKSNHASMYVNYEKEVKATDNNFMINVYYKKNEEAETVAMTYYVINGKYYLQESDIGDTTKGLSSVSLNNAIKVDKGDIMTMRVELLVYNKSYSASCNCNFALKMVNDI